MRSSIGKFVTQKYLSVRILLVLLACSSSCALLLKVWGIMEMHQAVWFVYLPSVVLILAIWAYTHLEHRTWLTEVMVIGCVAGLLATFAYDLIRIPFLMMGQRVFMSIDTYGVWILNAQFSTGLSDTVGWTYHFSNGISFGLIYALLMRGQHWLWAVVYALMLETVNLASPFFEIFRLSSNPDAISILYLGHVAYGIPLGLIVQHWDSSLTFIRAVPGAVGLLLLIVGFAWLFEEAFSSGRDDIDRHARAGAFQVINGRLVPELLRTHEAEIELVNSSEEAVVISNKTNGSEYQLPTGGSVKVTGLKNGITQWFVQTERRTFSSFLITEPVHP